MPAGNLKKVLIISRHGERERLVKYAHLLGESSDPPLSLGGLHDMAVLGEAMRSRYFEPDCTAGGTCLGSQEELMYSVRAESSGLARTLGSAEALMHTLYPDSIREAAAGLTLPTPVYSRRDGEDTVLRAYTKCPAHSARIAGWYDSDEFVQKDATSEELRRAVHEALTRLLPAEDLPVSLVDGATPLRDWWNAFDALDVALNANATAAASFGSLLSRAAELAAWTESNKFGSALASNTCGSALLREVSASLASLSGPKLQYYSAHYPTMLCALTALGLSSDSGDTADAWLATNLLPTGSALAFEVDGSDEVGLWLFHADTALGAGAGGPPMGWSRLPQNCPPKSSARVETCPLGDFSSSVSARLLPSDAAWCRACENTSLDKCRAAAAEGLVPAEGAAALCVVLSLLIVLIGFGCTWCYHKRAAGRARASPIVTEIGVRAFAGPGKDAESGARHV